VASQVLLNPFVIAWVRKQVDAAMILHCGQ
jgi:hypothetical protein